MTTYIAKPLLPKLLSRFGSQQGDDAKMTLSAQVVPITNADDLVIVPKVATQTTSAASVNHDFTVASGKQWILKALQTNRPNAGTIDIYIIDPTGTSNLFNSGGATTYSTLHISGESLRLTAGWVVRFAHGSATSGNIQSNLFYDEQDVL